MPTAPWPSDLLPLPSKDALVSRYASLPLSALPTPSLVLDRAVIRRNSRRMLEVAQRWDVPLRAHIKTTKTVECVKEMLGGKSSGNSSTGRVIVSTLAEGWALMDLVEAGIVDDILYGLPVSIHKLPELLALRARCLPLGAKVRLLVDHPDQIHAITSTGGPQAWSIMIKIDLGTHRAGLEPDSLALRRLLETIRNASSTCPLELYGFYAHAGHSYSSRSPEEADSFLTAEVLAVNRAAKVAKEILSDPLYEQGQQSWVLSVGSTPTAHAAHRAPTDNELKTTRQGLMGQLELHAGNYPVLDLQQLATRAREELLDQQPTAATMDNVAISVLCSVVSVYPGRNNSSESSMPSIAADEVLIDGASLAFSKDTGPWGGHGHVVYPTSLQGWELARPSQEHGVMAVRRGSPRDWERQWIIADDGTMDWPRRPVVGEKLRIVPQHACLTAACHPWFFIIDSDQPPDAASHPNEASKDSVKLAGRIDPLEQIVVDVWVPAKGW